VKNNDCHPYELVFSVGHSLCESNADIIEQHETS